MAQGRGQLTGTSEHEQVFGPESRKKSFSRQRKRYAEKHGGVRSRAIWETRVTSLGWLRCPLLSTVPLPQPASPLGFPIPAEALPAPQVHEPQIQAAPWHLPTHSSKLSPIPPKYSPNLPTSPPHLCRRHPPSSTHHLLLDYCHSLLTVPPHPPGSPTTHHPVLPEQPE